MQYNKKFTSVKKDKYDKTYSVTYFNTQLLLSI